MLSVLLLALTASAATPKYDGIDADAEPVVLEKPVTELSVELGGNFTTGNAWILNVIGGVRGLHRWKQNRFRFDGNTNLSYAKVDIDGSGSLSDEERAAPPIWTSQRILATARYDRFFGQRNSLYASVGAERDQLAGLLWRFNQQLGYSFLPVKSETTTLATEIGAAYTQENFVTSVDADGNVINADILDEHFIAARIFLGFAHKFNENVSFTNDLEMFENLFNLKDFRLYNTASFSFRFSDKFALKLSHRLLLDTEPVPGFRPVDQITALTLVASIF